MKKAYVYMFTIRQPKSVGFRTFLYVGMISCFHATGIHTPLATAVGTATSASARQVATKRIRELTELDLDAEAAKPNSLPLMWAVFAAFLK